MAARYFPGLIFCSNDRHSIVKPDAKASRNTTPAQIHLHQIGLGILLYCNDHQGRFPASLADLIIYENMSPDILIDPETDDTPAEGTSSEEIAANIKKSGHQTFIYRGAGLTDKVADAYTVVAYEIFADRSSDVLLGDGHTDWLTTEQTKSMLANQSSTHPTTIPSNF